MNKFFLILFFATYATLSLWSEQRNPYLYSIIFTDTQDESIGKAAQVSHDRYMNFFTKVESAIGSTDGPETIDFMKFECNNKNLLSTLNSLSCTPSDIVIFVYVGHGARAYDDPSNFPQMCFAVPKGKIYRNEKDFFPLESVRNIIMRKNPRFCLVIGDCCNSYGTSVSVKQPEPTDITMVDATPTIGWEEIKKMFLSKYGSVILTASQKGEYGWCTTSIDPLQSGMFLERNLNHVFDDIAKGRKKFSDWETLLEDVKSRTYEWSRQRQCIDKETGKRYFQTPYFEINLTDTPPLDTISKEKKYTTIKSELVRIADDRHLSDAERISTMRRVLAKYFDENTTMVDVVGIDNKTIIASPTIKGYLLSLATGQRLVNLTILTQEQNQEGKIVYLKVHEIYREKEY